MTRRSRLHCGSGLIGSTNCSHRSGPSRTRSRWSKSLFGGGTIITHLHPAAFANVVSAIDAWIQDPDPADAPYRRTLSERRADALDDMALFATTHDPDTDTDGLGDDGDHGNDDHGDSNDRTGGDDPDDEVDWDEMRATDTYDGSYPGDELDEALATLETDSDDTDEGDWVAPEDQTDPLLFLRRRLRKAEKHRRRRLRRRTRGRSGVLANVHIDLHTLAGTRDITDLEGLVLRGEGWHLTRSIAQRMLCDSSLVVTLFDGKAKVLDANEAAERFSRAQRRALAARDGHCVFPSCTREPRHCDAHHLHHRHDGGPTRVDNGALLCRFHHRLVHECRWRLRVDHTGHWVAIDPHGTRWTGRPTTLTPDPPEHPTEEYRSTTDQDAA